MCGGIITKSVGQNYEIEWDRNKYTVTLIFKGKPKAVFQFKRLCDSVNVYASIKKVKDAKRAVELKEVYPLLVLNNR